MDFWAQHKDFVLRVLAGVGVFLVALIARGIVHGDDLEKAVRKNGVLRNQIRNLKIIPPAKVTALEKARDDLRSNVRGFVDQLGWNATRGDLDLHLIERTLGRLRRVREAGEGAAASEARSAREALRADLNGGFGQLRLSVDADLRDEAGEKNMKLAEEIGFSSLRSLDGAELLKYLGQLELVTRVVRYALDVRAQAVEDIGIQTERSEPVPGANPQFLQEYAVRVRIRCSQAGQAQILNRLLADAPGVALREWRVRRLDQPADQVSVELIATVLLGNPDVPFAAPGKEGA